MPKIYDICAAADTWVDQHGIEKTKWLNVGAIIRADSGNVSIKLDAVPVRLNDKGELWLNCFAPKTPEEKQAAFGGRPAQPQGGFRQPVVLPPTPTAAPPPAPTPELPAGFAGVEPDDIPF